MAAGSIPDITPYFATTYKAGAEAAQLQVKADLERELARERAASQMAQTLVGGAFTVGGQLSSAALSHYLSEPLKATKAGAYDFERAYDQGPREAYLELIDPQLRLAAEARAEAEQEAIAPEPLREYESPEDWKLFEEINRGLEAQGLEPLSEEEFPAVSASKRLRVYEGGQKADIRVEATERHLERMRSVVRAGGSVGQELQKLDLGVPSYQRFIQDPSAMGLKPSSAEAGKLYATSQQIVRKRQLEIAEKHWKRSEREDKIRIDAERLVAKQVSDTDPYVTNNSGLQRRSFQVAKKVKANDLAARHGLVTDDKGRFYLRFAIGGQLGIVMLRTPLTRTQLRYLQPDVNIAFAVDAPLTAVETTARHRQLQQAKELKRAGAARFSWKIFNAQERDKADAPAWTFNAGPDDKSPIQVRDSNISEALMAPYDGKEGGISNVDAMIRWLQANRDDTVTIGAKKIRGGGTRASMDKMVVANAIAERLKEIQAQGPNTSRFIKELFYDNKSLRKFRPYRLGLRLFIHNHMEPGRGYAEQSMKGAGGTTVVPEAKRAKLRTQFESIFRRGMTALAKAPKTANEKFLAAMGAARGKDVVKIRVEGKNYNFSVSNWKGYHPKNKDIDVAKALLRMNGDEVGLLQLKKLKAAIKRNAVLKYFPGHIKGWIDATGAQKLGYDDALEVFRSNFPDRKVFSDEDFKTLWEGKKLSAVEAVRQRPPIASMDDDRLTKAIKAIGLMDISDKEKYRRFAHFRARMG